MSLMNIDWDSHNKEHERLVHDLLQAKIDRDDTQRHDIENRLEKLDDITWQFKRSNFPELLDYQSLFDALKQISSSLGMPFPVVSYSKEYRFIFIVSDETRGIMVIPRVSAGVYAVELKDNADSQIKKCGGYTASLREVAVVLSRWYVERCSIQELQNQFNWIT